jgi:hypothetical protein
MDHGEGISVYAEAKSEYTKQLCQYLVPSIQQYFLDLLEEAKQKEVDPKRTLLTFQTLLENISDWNVDKVQRETTSIIGASQCDYLEELMTAVFIAHTKVLSAIRLTTKQKKLQITIPKLDHFIHRILRECSRLLWSNTYLFSTSAPSIERQRNLRQIENFLQEGVLQGIRGMLPVKNILREYLKDDDTEEEEEEEEKPAPTKAESLQPPVEKPETVNETPISFTGSDTLDQEEEFNKEESEHEEPVVKNTAAKANKPKEKAEIIEAPEETLIIEGEDEIRILDSPPEQMDEFEDLLVKNEMALEYETLE